MAIDKDEVCIFIPALNEAPTVGGLIQSFRNLGFKHILVMDGHSTDGTAEIAAGEGARVAVQTGRGKGNAVIEAIGIIEQPYVLMIDGDGTYLAEDAEKLLDPLMSGADHVIGNRFARPQIGAFTRTNQFGNEIINHLFKIAYGIYLCDILSGYRAFTLSSVQALSLSQSGFEIETEISIETVRNSQEIKVVPIEYLKRPGTNTKLHPVRDGLRIASTMYRLAKMSNPLLYFGILGVFLGLIGTGIGIYVIIEWFKHIEHIPLTILTVLLIVVGFNVFMFGVLSDMMLTFHREVMDEIRQIKHGK